MENPTLGIRCRIIARIPTGIHRFDGNSHKIRSDPSRFGRRIKSPGKVVSRFSQCIEDRFLFRFLIRNFHSWGRDFSAPAVKTALIT